VSVRRERAAAGFTYIGLLFAVALAGVTLAATGMLWSTAVQREKEADLIFAGLEFASAIGRYRADHKGDGDGYPRTFEALVQDPRVPFTRRYLRKIYVDPMTGRAEWGIVRSPAGGIAGVHSLSTTRPLRSVLPSDVTVVAKAGDHSDWRFLAIAAAPSKPPGGTVAPAVQAAPPTAASPLALLASETPAAAAATPDPDDDCGWIRQSDLSACAAMRQRHGPARGDECLRSADRRQDACKSAGPTRIPSLRTNF
jgi:type II secretory pathway pseudopilin PulG